MRLLLSVFFLFYATSCLAWGAGFVYENGTVEFNPSATAVSGKTKLNIEKIKKDVAACYAGNKGIELDGARNPVVKCMGGRKDMGMKNIKIESR